MLNRNKAGLKKLFKHINNELFEGELEEPCLNVITEETMQIINEALFEGDTPFWGLTVINNKNQVFVGLNDTMDDQLFMDIFVHELIHVWQHQQGRDLGHGKDFQDMCQKAYEVFYLGIAA